MDVIKNVPAKTQCITYKLRPLKSIYKILQFLFISFQQPANYEFMYEVLDVESGNDYGHKESRQNDDTEGTYYVVLPDGRKQIVEYKATNDGYKPMVRYEGSASEDYGKSYNKEGPY